MSLSRVPCVTPLTVACQVPPSMGFSRQEYWGGSPVPSPGDFPDPGIKPRSPALQADAFTIWATREAYTVIKCNIIIYHIPIIYFIMYYDMNCNNNKLKWSDVAQSCPTLCDPVDCSLPGFSVHRIFQARILEWVAISFSSGSSQPRDRTRVSHIPGRRFTLWATRKATRHI